ncbi:MAG: YhcH/YjgK/YiaL family protein [Bacteroidales bacterium]|nr:YhcH/YjgK/YiaL family protein [Bacteroidales bacterium]
MKKFCLLLLCGAFAVTGFAQQKPSAEAQQWYKQALWRQGWKVKPYQEMDVETFYQQYQKNPAMYDSIFQWLITIDPLKMEPAKEVMKWEHAVAHCQDLELRTPENTQWEQHRKNIDLQWIARGSERLAVTRDTTILDAKNAYSEKKDVQNFRFKQAPTPEQYILLDSDPKLFYLFFPSDIHECCGIARKAETVRKIVVKIEYFE